MDDTVLKSLLTADAPPARDFAFELAVMARIEKRQFQHSLLRNAGMAMLAALVLALLAPPLQLVWQHDLAPIAGDVLIAIVLLATLFWSQLTARRN